MQSKKEKDYDRYKALKKIAANITHPDDNGNLVPNNPKYYKEVVDEIETFDKEYPDFNMLKDL